MSERPLASIIVNNYNYARFLRDAIDSALAQTYQSTEVIVVDDGSTDESPRIIASYGDCVIPVLKENGGQESALNAGFDVSQGKFVCFLDSDDALFPMALEKVAPLFRDRDIVKVHWPLRVADERGWLTGRLIPDSALPHGDLQAIVIEQGPNAYVTPPTSGNAWARTFLERVFPIPGGELRCGAADALLSMLAPLFGCIGRIEEPLGMYRIHGKNHYWGKMLENLPGALRAREQHCRALSRVLRDRGMDIDPNVWLRDSWLRKLQRAVGDIHGLIPSGDTFILVDDDQWGVPHVLAGRRRIPFLEREGRYWGPPPDDGTAIRELERLKRAGAGFIAIAWPSFWWLVHYAEFHRYLRSTYRCITENECLVVFELQP